MIIHGTLIWDQLITKLCEYFLNMVCMDMECLFFFLWNAMELMWGKSLKLYILSNVNPFVYPSVLMFDVHVVTFSISLGSRLFDHKNFVNV